MICVYLAIVCFLTSRIYNFKWCCGQSYEFSTIANYDLRVALTRKRLTLRPYNRKLQPQSVCKINPRCLKSRL